MMSGTNATGLFCECIIAKYISLPMLIPTVSFSEGYFVHTVVYSSEVGYLVWFHTSKAMALITSDLAFPVTSLLVMLSLSSVELENLGMVNAAAQLLIPREWCILEVAVHPDTGT